VPHDEAESTSGDVTIDWNGSVFLFTPRSSRVREWMTENADSEQQWWRGALVVEWRYARDVASIMRESGLAVTPVNRTAAEAYDSLPQ